MGSQFVETAPNEPYLLVIKNKTKQKTFSCSLSQKIRATFMTPIVQQIVAEVTFHLL